MFRFRKSKGLQPMPSKRDLLPRRVFRKSLRPMDKRVLVTLERARPDLFWKELLDLKTAKARRWIARLSALMQHEQIEGRTLKELLTGEVMGSPGTKLVSNLRDVPGLLHDYARIKRYNREHPIRKQL